MAPEDIRGSGNSTAGVGQFLAGLVMAGVGLYLLLNQVVVTSSFWNLFGFNAFGLTMLPLLVGVGFLFFSSKSAVGWVLTILGAAIIVAEIFMNMQIFFKPTSLYNTLVMLVLIAGGVGLIARSFRVAKVVQPPRGGEKPSA